MHLCTVDDIETLASDDSKKIDTRAKEKATGTTEEQDVLEVSRLMRIQS
jgi:hypothetical protein